MVSDLHLVLKIWLGWSGSFQSQYFDCQNHRFRYFCPWLNILLLPLQNVTGSQPEICVHNINARKRVQQLRENTACCGHKHGCDAFSISPSALVVVTTLKCLHCTLQHLKINCDDSSFFHNLGVNYYICASMTTMLPIHNGKALDRKPR